MPVECKILRCRRLYLSATDPRLLVRDPEYARGGHAVSSAARLMVSEFPLEELARCGGHANGTRR